ncbi:PLASMODESMATA CALLOSE-BINDING PROTEIN 3 [Prunus yedoensis var. nudiflora]|uniref:PLASMODESMATA CALLOSE-BINDING PROTEIN 3 n=1 Tax=Prunus yedoensis var. nudiflora TaxID=2094558 RepID=A0A314XLQ8_PRUYE|nr:PLASMODESMATA CALLOSE-BINDING PROTEIN 3 [Prunus yedoensis var. nudiflora]
MAALVCIVVLLALTGHSSATYCICKDGVGDSALQKALDYACGAGADCAPILQSGACYQPNTIKDHCNYAVNSYFQRKGQTAQSCDFAGAATQSPTAPTSSSTSTCVYPSSTR